MEFTLYWFQWKFHWIPVGKKCLNPLHSSGYTCQLQCFGCLWDGSFEYLQLAVASLATYNICFGWNPRKIVCNSARYLVACHSFQCHLLLTRVCPKVGGIFPAPLPLATVCCVGSLSKYYLPPQATACCWAPEIKSPTLWSWVLKWNSDPLPPTPTPPHSKSVIVPLK